MIEIGKILPVKKLVVNTRMKELCKLPYPNHPKGCPLYGIKDKCPPKSPRAEVLFDLSKPMYFVYVEFNLEDHAKKLKEKYPHWTERQTKNVLYWQPGVRKRLNTAVKEAIKKLGTTAYSFAPESLGVNVYASAWLSGLKLERIRDLKIDRHIALIGFKK
jgi:predicted metal-binding protein